MRTADINDYFASIAHPYWRWEDEGNVIAWADGTTIAFRIELVSVLERLQLHCLPPVGSVVLLLAACRDSWGEPPSKLGLLNGVLQTGNRTDRVDLLNRVAAGLDKVRALGADLRASLAHKGELAAMVFEDQGCALAPSAYDRLLNALRAGAEESYPVRGAKRSAVDWLLRDLAWLERGLERVEERALRLRLRTGLEQPILPAPIEVPALGTARSLIADLKYDPELGGVARLAELLMAAVLMPRPLSEPEELPLGGVSDISNRGSLDRLLLSELANDDLTLAVRVAMNEALYLRRETPPRTPSRRRLVLLDAGLRTWGVPRVFATAVGLALAAGADAGVDVTVFRAAGGELEPVDMTSSGGLTDHLSALDFRVHPGEALDRLAEAARTADETTDVVVVTADDVAADRAFQRAVGESELPELFVATVARDGTFELVRHSKRGRKSLRQAQLDLDAVLAPPTKPTAKLVDKSPDLPAIFHTAEFPLYLSAAVDAQRSWHVRDFGVLTLTADGRLLHWEKPTRGARQLAEGLPSGGLHWAATVFRHDHILAVIGKRRAAGFHSLRIPIDGGPPTTVELQTQIEHPQYLFARDDVVFIGDQNRVEAASATSGVHLGFAPTNDPEVGYHTHRYEGIFTHWSKTHGGLEWTAAAFDGSSVRLDRFIYGGYGDSPRVTGVFRVQGREPAIGITPDGGILELENKRLIRKIGFYQASSIAVERQSRSGAKLLVAARNGATVHRRIVDLANMEGQFVELNLPEDVSGRQYDHLIEPEIYAGASPVELRRKFHAIGVDADGRLALVGRREKRWPFVVPHVDHHASDHGHLRFAETPNDAVLKVSQPFRPMDELDPNPYSLSVATFRDGSRAYLDGRGLLHLSSSDPAVSQITIVLRSGPISGWMSDGGAWGSAYFLASETTTTMTARQLGQIRQFVERLA
jgi:hypothetical protein